MFFQFGLVLAGIIAGTAAAIAGFGIGSLLTPFLLIKISIGLAVGVVSIAHLLGTLLRFLIWWRYANTKVLLSFGVTSAFGGLIGAFLHSMFYNAVLTIIFGCLLVFAGLSGLSGLSQRLRLKGIAAFITGALTGFLGGLVGNQGGIRSAALTGFNLDQREFIATATGVALMVDLVRVPVYLSFQGSQIFQFKTYIILSTLAVLAGTVFGGIVLRRISKEGFKEVVSLLLLISGIFVLIRL